MDVPTHILEYPDQVAPGEMLVPAFSKGPFDDLPDLRASWYASVNGSDRRFFMSHYLDKNEGDMHSIDFSAAIERQQLEEREHAQPTNDESHETEGVEGDLPAEDADMTLF
jgi:hypothetical protein